MLTDCKKDRWPGARIKHRVKNNWLKMYDKFGQILRIETVINNPREFKVRRRKQRQGRWQMVWCPMNKGVCNFYRYREVALAANERYLEAMSVVDDPAPAYRQLKKLTEPVVRAGRSSPASTRRVAPMSTCSQSCWTATICCAAWKCRHPRSPVQNDRRLRTRVVVKARRWGVAEARLHMHRLIKKVPRSRRWLVTNQGQQVLGAVLQLYHHGIPAALGTAA